MAGTSGIAFTGLSSGLDTAKIVDAMLKIDQTRVDALQTQRAAVTNQVSMFGTLKSKLATMQTAMDALRFQSQLFTRSVTTDTPSGQPAVVNATADSTATIGSFKVTVDQLATQAKRLGATGVGSDAINTGVAVGVSGLRTTPTSGTVTINGV